MPDQTEIIITATKREENLQNVPISVQVLGTRKLDQLNISNFEQYTKQLPSVTFQTAQPGLTTVYMRGVAALGGDGNHSGSLPSVGPISTSSRSPRSAERSTFTSTTSPGSKASPGRRARLYGASSEAGTIRIITNKPELGVTTGRVDGELNTRRAWRHRRQARRDDQHPDRRRASRSAQSASTSTTPATSTMSSATAATYLAPTNHGAERTSISTTASSSKRTSTTHETYGGRAALKIDLDDNWTVTPTVHVPEDEGPRRLLGWMPTRRSQTVRFQMKVRKDRFWQAALTIEGKIANFFDVTYAGAYMDRPRSSTSDYTDYTDAYNEYYTITISYGIYGYGSSGGLSCCQIAATMPATSSIRASTSPAAIISRN